MDTTVSRRSLAGLLGLLGLGTLGVPLPNSAPEVLPACSMYIVCTFAGPPRRNEGFWVDVAATPEGWRLQARFSHTTGETYAMPLDATGNGELARLLTAVLAAEEPDPARELEAAIVAMQATLDRRAA